MQCRTKFFQQFTEINTLISQIYKKDLGSVQCISCTQQVHVEIEFIDLIAADAESFLFFFQVSFEIGMIVFSCSADNRLARHMKSVFFNGKGICITLSHFNSLLGFNNHPFTLLVIIFIRTEGIRLAGSSESDSDGKRILYCLLFCSFFTFMQCLAHGAAPPICNMPDPLINSGH